MRFTRRHILKGAGALLAALGLRGFAHPAHAARPVTGRIMGAAAAAGHRLRQGGFPAPSETLRNDAVIVGGGIAGLGAGYRLHKAGLKDFALLELESATGGNAQAGRNEVSAYPWGAHYVPLLTADSKAVRALFEEFGVIKGYDKKGLPLYNEFYTCSDPHERLFMFDRWQETLLPQVGATAEDRAQYARFFRHMDTLEDTRGSDGRRIFAIPVDESSQDEKWLALDRLTMKEWMDREGYTSEYLRWHVNYCCRDDYGTTYDQASAWTGLHYFAARSGLAGNTDDNNFVTWPEGNNWLAQKLAAPIAGNIRTGCLVHAVRKQGGGVVVDYLDLAANVSRRIEARTCILATPQFVSARLAPGEAVEGFSYAPWAVANITLARLPEGKGAELAWDNMVYGSKLLGYVVATHQNTEMQPLRTVVTYYWPLDHLPPAEARQEALARKYEEWRDIFLAEFLSVHPELKGHVLGLDVWVWGHAMIRPVPGVIWGEARRALLKQQPPLFRAHSDMSGISIFEEAYTHGVRAAEGALSHLGVSYKSVLR